MTVFVRDFYDKAQITNDHSVRGRNIAFISVCIGETHFFVSAQERMAADFSHVAIDVVFADC
jgi:hypothetical protein